MKHDVQWKWLKCTKANIYWRYMAYCETARNHLYTHTNSISRLNYLMCYIIETVRPGEQIEVDWSNMRINFMIVLWEYLEHLLY